MRLSALGFAVLTASWFATDLRAQETQPSPTPAAAETVEPVHTTVGVPAHVYGVVLPGSEFEPVETDAKSEIVVRVEHVQKHGSAHRYAFEFTGLVKGEFDLAKFLRRKDRSDNGPMPTIPVVVDALLPVLQNEPNALGSLPAPRLGGYQTLLWTLGVVWVVGLFGILFLFKKKPAAAAIAAKPITLADRLRPIVARALEKDLSSEQRAELERLLLSVWRTRLGLADVPAREAVQALRTHTEAGALLRELERWLHQKDPAPFDVEALLRPYAAMRDDERGVTA